MIVAEKKPMGDILDMVQGIEKLLVVGCGTCVTVCLAGGEKEVALTASALRLARSRNGETVSITELTIERQCDWEFMDAISDAIGECGAVLSLGCGAGVQAMAARFPETPVFPALNTKFLGITEEQGIWTERCMACGNCMLDRTAAVCPVARCAKSIMNGPCGGSQDGKCEIDQESDCAWQLIYDRLEYLGRLRILEEIEPPRDWSTSRDGGPRKVERKDMML